MATDTYPLQDLNFNTIALSDDTGKIIAAFDTDATGKTLAFSGPGTSGDWFADDAVQTDEPALDYIYAGRRFDPETENYYYRARYYSPSQGRFISRDAKDYVDGMNLYQYVKGNPVNFTDPSGEFVWVPAAAFFYTWFMGLYIGNRIGFHLFVSHEDCRKAYAKNEQIIVALQTIIDSHGATTFADVRLSGDWGQVGQASDNRAITYYESWSNVTMYYSALEEGIARWISGAATASPDTIEASERAILASALLDRHENMQNYLSRKCAPVYCDPKDFGGIDSGLGQKIRDWGWIVNPFNVD